MIFDKYFKYLTKLPGIWQIWWYLITNSELFAEEIHLFAIKYHPFCQITGSFAKYVKYLSNISVFDRNYLMKKWSFTSSFHPLFSLRNLWAYLNLLRCGTLFGKGQRCRSLEWRPEIAARGEEVPKGLPIKSVGCLVCVVPSPEKKANVIVFVFVEISRPFSQQLFTIGYYVKVFVRTILYLLKSITGRELIIGKTLVFLPESLKLRTFRKPEDRRLKLTSKDARNEGSGRSGTTSWLG